MINRLTTCLCLTRNRRAWLPKAIRAWELQTAVNDTELLIVADQESDVEGLVPQNPLVRVLFSRGTVGRKRNAGCAEARGEFIAIWDDDDYSAPGRIADQRRALERSGKSVTGYTTLKFTDGVSWWEYSNGQTNFVMATSLFFRREYWVSHPFPPDQIGQDESFTYQAHDLGQLLREPDKQLMFATIHQSNTSPRRIHPHNWKPLPGFQWRDGVVEEEDSRSPFREPGVPCVPGMGLSQ